MNIIIEGLDRLGKSTLAANLEHRLGCFTHIHFGKPPVLSCYLQEVGATSFNFSTSEALKAKALYQRESFKLMFKLLSGPGRFILDRAHLGEAVYAKRYRSYDGDYVFNYETIEHGNALANTLLVLLVNYDPKLEERLVDDGQSFDWSKRKEEQDDFISAFNRSRFVNKLLLPVGNGAGEFINAELLTDLVTIKYNDALFHTR